MNSSASAAHAFLLCCVLVDIIKIFFQKDMIILWGIFIFSFQRLCVMGIYYILSLTGKNAEVSREYPQLPRMHLNDCIMIIMDRGVQSAGSGGHAERHPRENVILTAERLLNTCTFDITAAVSYPSKTFFYHLYNFDVVFLEDLPLPHKNSWINFPMTSPGIMGQRHPSRLRPPVDTRWTMHVTEKQQLSWSGDRSPLRRVWGQYQQREKTTCPLNVSPCCLSLAVNMQRLICTGHCVVIMNSGTRESELLFLNVNLSQFEWGNNRLCFKIWCFLIWQQYIYTYTVCDLYRY